MKGQTSCDQCGYGIPRTNPLKLPSITYDLPNGKAVRNLASIKTQAFVPGVIQITSVPAEDDAKSMTSARSSTVGGVSRSTILKIAKTWIREAKKHDLEDFEEWVGSTTFKTFMGEVDESQKYAHTFDQILAEITRSN